MLLDKICFKLCFNRIISIFSSMSALLLVFSLKPQYEYSSAFLSVTLVSMAGLRLGECSCSMNDKGV